MKIKLQFLEAISYDKFKNLLDEEMFKFFLDLDPTSKKKYSQWIIHSFFKLFKKHIDKLFAEAKLGNNPNDKNDKNIYTYPLSKNLVQLLSEFYDKSMSLHTFFSEDASKITQDLKKYDKLNNKNILSQEDKNIHNIQGYADLWEVLNKYSKEIDEIELKEKPLSDEDRKKLFENDEWLVVIPLTFKASCKYGANTRWCTTAKDDPSYFEYYSKDGPLIIIINKKDNNKWQLHFESSQWKDERDEEINRDSLLTLLPNDLKKSIYDETKNILFLPNLYKYIYKILEQGDKSFLKELFTILDGSDIYTSWECLYNNDSTAEYPFSREVLLLAIEESLYDSSYTNDESYTYGYDHPWQYISEEPKDIENAEECSECEGKGLVLPNNLSPETYDSIEKGINQYANNKLNSLEQKRLLSLYKPYDTGKLKGYHLIYNDDEIKEKLGQKCSKCKGSGKNIENNPEVYSEEQREEAGQKSEAESYAFEAKEILNYFRSFYTAYREIGKDTVIKIFDKVIEILHYQDISTRKTDIYSIIEAILNINEEDYYKPNIEPILTKYIQEVNIESKE